MAAVLFYERAVALSREFHQSLRMNTAPDHFAFAGKTSSVLTAGSEFSKVLRDYPIVFVGQAGQPLAAMALTGLAENENLFVTDKGEWLADTYIPAFIRRYPFVLAGADNVSELTVCVDEAYAGLSSQHGEALFDGAGGETAYLQNVMDFLRLFHTEMLRTAAFTQKLVDLDLLRSQVITVERGERKRTLEGLWVVDEARLNALDEAHKLDLLRSGYLLWIHAHLLSLSNLERLVLRQDALLQTARAALSRARKTPFAVAHRPRYSELYLRHGDKRAVHFRPGTDCPSSVLKAAGLLFDLGGDGLLAASRFQELKRFLRAVAKTGHDLRVYGDVLNLIAHRRDAPRRNVAMERLFPMRKHGVTHY